MSAISRMPAFSHCSSSPACGCSTSTTTSATVRTATSPCPAPTVSTKMRSKPNDCMTSSMHLMLFAIPCWPAAVDKLRINTRSTFEVPAMRQRSPNSAPPVIGLSGSQASTPTVSPRAAKCVVTALNKLLLPTPALPVNAMIGGWLCFAFVSEAVSESFSSPLAANVNRRDNAARSRCVKRLTSVETSFL